MTKCGTCPPQPLFYFSLRKSFRRQRLGDYALASGFCLHKSKWSVNVVTKSKSASGLRSRLRCARSRQPINTIRRTLGNFRDSGSNRPRNRSVETGPCVARRPRRTSTGEEAGQAEEGCRRRYTCLKETRQKEEESQS